MPRSNHTFIQQKLKQWIQEPCTLEKPFRQISRIADLAITSTQIALEVQCSPISFDEVRARERDYASIGWRLIWILDDQRFNKTHLSRAEEYLRSKPSYFASIRGDRLILYDQFERISARRRHRRSLPLEMGSFLCKTLSTLPPKDLEMPPHLTERMKQGSLYLEGDCVSYLQEQPDTGALYLQIFEKKPKGLQKITQKLGRIRRKAHQWIDQLIESME